jgi:hypothetical protein
MDVINISPRTAIVRYIFKVLGAMCQFRYSQLADTNLPTSKVLAISITGPTAAPNNALKPIILYQAATPAIDNADNNVIIAKITKILLCTSHSTYLPKN